MRILIVEDDVLIAEHLKEIIASETNDEVSMAFSAMNATKLLQAQEFDLLLLDINMESPEAGIELASFVTQNYSIPFIFITAQSNSQIIGRAILTQPAAFIVKPFSSISVLAAIDIARQNMQNDNLIIRDGYKEVVIPMKGILYGKASNNYIEIFGLKRKWVIRITMQKILELLPNESFIQIHRSYFVNKHFVESISTAKLSVHGEVLPISKGFECQTKAILQQRS